MACTTNFNLVLKLLFREKKKKVTAPICVSGVLIQQSETDPFSFESEEGIRFTSDGGSQILSSQFEVYESRNAL